MNISALTIYLWQLADSLCGTLTVLSFVSGITALIASVGCAVVHGEGVDDLKAPAKRLATWCAGAFTVILLAKTLTPSSNTVAMMVVIPKLAESKVIQKDIPDLYNAAVEALKGAMKPAK